MEENNKNKLTLIQIYHDQAKTKLWRQYYDDQFGYSQGEYKFWFDNGQIGIISNFKDGRWHGKRQSWWSDGRRTHIETHHFKRRLHGIEIIFKYKSKIDK